MNNTYSIKDIIKLLLNHIRLIVFFSILGAIAGYCISKYAIPLKYSSHITMYVQSYTSISENTDNINNISNSKQLVNTYIEVLKDEAVMEAVSNQLLDQFDINTIAENFSINPEGRISPASIRSCLTITSVSDTSAINVTATAKNAEVASYICNALTKVAPQYMEEAVGVGSINTIGTAKTNYGPVSPNKSKNTMAGGAVGFMLIVSIIFIIDFFDNTIKDPDTLKEKYKKAIIGEIQQLDENGTKKRKHSEESEYFKLTDKNVPFCIVENYKSIRTNLSFALSTNENKIFAVSSSKLGDGKSITSANIAIAMAQSGSKVLLIDADMRKTNQHKIFNLKNKKGLSTAISKMDPLHKCIQKNVMANLDVMTAGPIPPNPSELLASEQMASILDELSIQYSVIIIDTPPVNIVTDAMELAKNVSGIVMVVRYGFTTDEDLKTASKRIELAQMNMLGFILNGIKPQKNNSYYSRYRYGSKYYYKKGYENSYDHGYYGKKPEMNLKHTS
ncbi:polysaccharide biosynthesis tyrosine autokinase [uncultured Ruminococcus sp.]|uniref:polysaccharide biosynthesis tyrosine autokinase n=1 Tax=uncultured Ruminococcus sp. TaxID=165186 RepID=UPI002633248D|nr:polysaccharide biosynthesis tyrosine autokinase [uncultured Ruminococcus sp.]